MVTLDTVSPIVFGAGALNTTYNTDPEISDVAGLLRYAIDHGINAFDTSAFYGRSETVLGNGLREIAADPRYARSSYFLISKAGRWEDDTFDYSEASIRSSVKRSLERLGTSYLDLLLIHDVEFQQIDMALVALRTALALKNEGLVRNIGLSGYPLPILYGVIKAATSELGPVLDAVLSYCHLTLQNDLLLQYRAKFKDAGIKVVFNASPLSMSLLRSGPTHDFHPASAGLRARAKQVGDKLRAENVELADVASQYSFAMWDGPTVIGIRTTSEIDAAIANRQRALESPQPELWKKLINDFGELHNLSWPSPPA